MTERRRPRPLRAPRFINPSLSGEGAITPDGPKLHPLLEGKVIRETLTIGGRRSSELLQAMAQKGASFDSYVRGMIESPVFTTLPEPTEFDLVRVRVADLITRKRPTTREILEKADESWLDKVPAEVGPHYRLAHMDQPLGEWVAMGMEPISPSGDYYPDVFEVGHNDHGLWLAARCWTASGNELWDLNDWFVFSPRK